MKERVYRYFENLEARNLPKEEETFLVDNIRYKQDPNNADKINIDGIPFFVKSFDGKYSVNNIAVANMYNEISNTHRDFGIITPPVYLISTPGKKSTRLSTITQDITSIDDDLEYVVGYNLHQLRREILLYNSKRKNRWELICNEDIRQTHLRYMTESCYEKLISLYLLAELRTEIDVNKGNIVFVRRKGNKRFFDIIPLDHELAQIVVSNPTTKEEFQKFINTKYLAETPLESQDELNYISRIKELTKIINSGLISKDNLNAMKYFITYDLSTKIDDLCKNNPHLNKSDYNPSEAYKYLQEYYLKTISHELGL